MTTKKYDFHEATHENIAVHQNQQFSNSDVTVSNLFHEQATLGTSFLVLEQVQTFGPVSLSGFIIHWYISDDHQKA